MMPSAPGASRTWGFWTEHKLSILAEYLCAFTTASRSARRTLYLDLFAGQETNISRTTGDLISGSPRVALDTTPPFSKIVLFERPKRAAKLEAGLRAAYPGRDIDVIPGDCNNEIGDVLGGLVRGEWDWAPTFAFLDQQAAEIRWTTLLTLSDFRRSGRTKTELWLLFAPSMLPRGLASESAEAAERFAERITAMYGCEDWRDPYIARQNGLMTAADLRAELLNLMRWRLEKVLRYRVTHAFELRNTRDQPLYDMVFATDHPAGEKIMNHIYGKAAERHPQMRVEANAKLQAMDETRTGALGLFPPLPKVVEAAELYRHQPPWEPYRLPERS